jgi:hypothetical protein
VETALVVISIAKHVKIGVRAMWVINDENDKSLFVVRGNSASEAFDKAEAFLTVFTQETYSADSVRFAPGRVPRIIIEQEGRVIAFWSMEEIHEIV